MRHREGLRALLGAVCFVAGVSAGCGGDRESTTGPGSTGVGGGGGQGGLSTGTSGGMGGGGSGGAGQAPDTGRPGTELVSAGQQSASANYRMVFTLGQPTQNQGTSTSASYRLQGGLVGANGSLP